MKKKTVLITGSTSGIGLGIAKGFAAKGYQLVFNGLESNGASIAAEVAGEHGVDYMFSAANMLDPDALKKMVEEATAMFGGIDILINNAGIQHVAPIESFPDNKWYDIIGINLHAAYHLTKAVWPYMKERQFGRIINIASAHGLVASEFKSAYVAAKHGLVGFTKTAALEGAPFNITCNAICPGYVKTPLVEKQVADQALTHGIPESEVAAKVMLHKQAVKSFVPVEVLAEMALLLAVEGSGTITGTAIPLDGGWSAQ
ncbi:3-hydroxybutyrate dehydrogenase [Flavihumibacter sp. UBA7668]|uniref:3-hydroxybutyrate dehydrogenase n=1 Tax=Flavihumibacter sp. UBA7668 TaxID=1946542 RepID=UPI0025BB63EC|nr:3-hydroxybutyrate dehydrogenase [Flavihumibacter sp. UBA7668]